MFSIVVDDNKIARYTVKQLARQIPDLMISGEFDNASDARNYLLDFPVDLILLDIEMPGMSGIELSRNLGDKHPLIIFTTSKKDYAVEAFELNVVDYLVKPITPSRFSQAIDRARAIITSNTEEVRMNNDEFIFIRDSNIVRKLRLDDILFAEAMGDYVKLFTAQKFFAIHTTMRLVEERLPAGEFIRVHRSYLIAVNKIDRIQEGSIVINGKPLPVGDVYRAALNKRMNVL
ncbi:MAG TPA: LytTR family DNA-binding domain-containing protein [Puia sp.]|nr:LytTR family DNA-binding domain-containing protein [Puia sp.]